MYKTETISQFSGILLDESDSASFPTESEVEEGKHASQKLIAKAF